MNYPFIVFMKVGPHAGESFELIMQRKQQEIADTGMAFWGYGGTLCHPFTQIRPFVDFARRMGSDVLLAMSIVKGKGGNTLVSAEAVEYTADDYGWKPIPSEIRVTGSKYALVLGDLREERFECDLQKYAVGVGRHAGYPASTYIRDRVDKACLCWRLGPEMGEERVLSVSYVAKLCAPYAVKVRNEKE